MATLDSQKLHRLNEYASFLKEKAASEEKEKQYSEAIPTYLKLVDVLLIMADSAPSHQYWVRWTTEAESYQKKIKSLIALASVEQEKVQVQ